MQVSIIVLCVGYILLQLMLKEKIYRPSVLLAILWGTIIFLYSLGYYDLPRVKDETYIIILSALLCFFIGSALARLSKYKIRIGSHQLFSKQINQQLFKILRVLFFGIMLLPAVRAIRLLLGGASLYTIRYTLQSDILGSGVIAILFNYYCEPFLTFMIVYSVANYFSKNRNVWNIITTVIGLVLMTIISGGRFFILYLAGALVIAFLLYRKKYKKDKERSERKTLKRAKGLIIIALVAIITVSVFRGSAIIKTVYVYLCGGVPFFEHLNNTLVTEHTNGAAMLYGFLRPVFVVLRKVGICELPVWLQNVEEIFLSVDNPYYLTPETIFNSFSTSFFAPYLDGGIFGVCLTYLILGYIFECIYKKVQLDNEYMISWFLLISLVVVFSFFRLLITHYSFALAFVYLFLTHRSIAKNNAE